MLRLTGRVLRGVAMAAALICAYAAGVAGSDAPRRQPSVLDDALLRISKEADRPIPAADLRRAAITAMLQRLGDPWARYFTAQEYDDVSGRLSGRYSGVGLWLGTAETSVRVASVQPGSASAVAGVRVGDVITGVAGRSASGWTVTDVASALRGRPGSLVALEIHRDDGTHHFSLLRSTLRTSDVTVSHRPGGVLLVGIGAFTAGVGRQVRDAVSGGHRNGIVLDLRGDPGGLLEEAVATASAFLPYGPVVTFERRGVPPQHYGVTAPGDGRTPLVVMVDAGTASAAEIVAGSLRDRDRAVIVGSRTFGKGAVEETVGLQDGSAMELTVGRYLTPAGRSLDGVGIDPDVAVSADRPPEVAEQRALSVLRGLQAATPH